MARPSRALSLVLWLALAVPEAAPLLGQTPYRAAQGTISMALAGDAIVSRPFSASSEPEFLEMVEVIRGADVAYTNLEIVLQHLAELTPMTSDGESYMFASPALARELAWMGFDMVSRANNHVLDYGWDGMRATGRALEEAGIAHAGAGENLALAEAPAFVQSAAGRVGVVSTASTFESFHAARPQRRDIRATPGLNPIRYRRVHVLPGDRFADLGRVAEALGQGPARGDTLRFQGETYVRGREPGVRTRADPSDLARILRAVEATRREADWVVVATHSHERAGAREVPADFIVEYARAAIDAGADVFVGTGPHVLRGIEIYKGRPIFYSLGNFFFENETVPYRPSAEWQRIEDPASGHDAHTVDFYDERQRTRGGYFTTDPHYWQSVIAVPSFEAGRLAEIRLYPITLGYQTPRSQRGRAMRASPEMSREIIDRLARLSVPYGTEVRFVEGVGVIRPSGAATEGWP